MDPTFKWVLEDWSNNQNQLVSHYLFISCIFYVNPHYVCIWINSFHKLQVLCNYPHYILLLSLFSTTTFYSCLLSTFWGIFIWGKFFFFLFFISAKGLDQKIYICGKRDSHTQWDRTHSGGSHKRRKKPQHMKSENSHLRMSWRREA